MADHRTVIATGVRLLYDGGLWDVVELDAPSVLLRDAAGGLRQVALGQLLSAPTTQLIEAGEREPIEGLGADLSNLSKEAKAAFHERLAHMQELRTGFRRGHRELALPGEPRAQFDPEHSWGSRYAAKAVELGVGESTVRAWLQAFKTSGPAALMDGRWSQRQDELAGADPRWLETARAVLAEHADKSRPTQDVVLATVQARLEADESTVSVRIPSLTAGRRLLRALSRGTGAFGGTKTKRSAASRPDTPYGRLRATRPGEYLVLDTTPLDVFAMDPVTLRWVNAELTIAMDLYDRVICGLRLTPVSTKAVDAASVLFDAVRPLPDRAEGFLIGGELYHGLPRGVIVDADKLVDDEGGPVLPSVAAETVIVDNGRIYLSDHLMSACERLGASVQPARPYQATDKAALERFFRTLREQLLVPLPGYKGPDVYSRGKDVEKDAYFFLDELELIIRQWVHTCYHRARHSGLCVPEIPGLELSPLEMYAHGVNRAGFVQVPARPDLVFDFLQVAWRTIQHYGVEVGGLRYDGRALNPYRNSASPYTGVNQGKWPLRVDPGDVSRIYFQDPKSLAWHALRWEHADALAGPFSAEALAYARRLAESQHRFPDVKRALAELLELWGAGLAQTPAERRMALRVSQQRLRLVPDGAALEEDEPVRRGPATAAAQTDADLAGDDDCEEEMDAAPVGDDDEGDFYGDAMAVA
jgi:transposase InsO family protein